jgi:hypothetical protein
MKTYKNPQEANAPIHEFTYEGCRYAGIPVGMTFSVLSDGLANYLTETFSFLEEISVAPVAENEFCCSKCGRDCKSSFMKERHEKVCKELPQGLAVILKPTYIFWNYKNLDKTQLTPDQLIPEHAIQSSPNPVSEKEITEPAPGRDGMAMIGKTMQKVTTDNEGVDWYGPGIEDDIVG